MPCIAYLCSSNVVSRKYHPERYQHTCPRHILVGASLSEARRAAPRAWNLALRGALRPKQRAAPASMPPGTTAATTCKLPADLAWCLALAGTGAPNAPCQRPCFQQQLALRPRFRINHRMDGLSSGVRRSILPDEAKHGADQLMLLAQCPTQLHTTDAEASQGFAPGPIPGRAHPRQALRPVALRADLAAAARLSCVVSSAPAALLARV